MNTQGSQASCVCATESQLGEGPIWVPQERALWFVDIRQQRICRLEPATATVRHWQAPGKVSFVLPTQSGVFLVGLPGAVARFNPVDGRFETVLHLAQEPSGNRLNDACIDPAGRLWFGSMDDAEQTPTGGLYSWSGAGPEAKHDAGYVISNGPAFSPDGRVMYHTDTLKREIYRFDVAEGGHLKHKQTLIRVEPSAGWPDGTTIDSEGCLWVALYGGWSVRRYSPGGELLQSVSVPCANITKVAFGGDDLRTVYVTTARKELSAADLESQPQAGGLFAFAVDVPGLVQPVFNDIGAH